jgi:hypothetical protein
MFTFQESKIIWVTPGTYDLIQPINNKIVAAGHLGSAHETLADYREVKLSIA